MKISFIGAGNMAGSIIAALVSGGTPAHDITVSAPSLTRTKPLADQLGVKITDDNRKAVAEADVVVLAVKPQNMAEVCKHIAGYLPQQALVISVAAGLTCAHFESWLGSNVAVVRSMPNTPSKIGSGASGLYANHNTSAAQQQVAESILKATGIVAWVKDEALIDSVTAVSGSGPAYIFLMVESMIDAAVEQGMDRQAATDLALQTTLGAAKLAQQSDVDVAELRRQVTSPNGTTERAIASFEQAGFREVVKNAMLACADRAREMAQSLKK